MEPIVESSLNEGQKMIYGRRRIIDVLCQDRSELSLIEAKDIASISLQDDLVCCQVEDTNLFVKRADVIKNFWHHRTRTPSYFDYKIWSQAMSRGPWQGIPVAVIVTGKQTKSS